jgi:hypothetical protein
MLEVQLVAISNKNIIGLILDNADGYYGTDQSRSTMHCGLTSRLNIVMIHPNKLADYRDNRSRHENGWVHALLTLSIAPLWRSAEKAYNIIDQTEVF